MLSKKSRRRHVKKNKENVVTQDVVTQELKPKESDEATALIERVKNIVTLTANDPQFAKAMGFQTGINTSVIINELNRIKKGQATKQEILNLIDNLWNIARGYFAGDRAFKEIINEISESLTKAKKLISSEITKEYSEYDNKKV